MTLRVAFSHNYSMELARARYAAGKYPGQHLYGVTRLHQLGFDVRYVRPGDSRAAAYASRRLGLRFGELSSERHILAMTKHVDVCFAGEPHHVAGLARLRRYGAFRKPIVAVVHQLPRPADSAWLRGLDGVVCLASLVGDHVSTRVRAGCIVRVLPWGPDLEFAGYRAGTPELVICAGKTNRDTTTLLSALRDVPAAARVYMFAAPVAPVPDNVEIVSTTMHMDAGGAGAPQFAYEDVLADMRRASVVAIPLANPMMLSGLSELNEALALAKPVVMTRSPFIDLDIEGEGCGVWVDHGDVAGWRAAITRFVTNPELSARAGARGRDLAERRWNSRAFGDGLSTLLAQVSAVA